ncbi:hypothetical protein B0H16DRAFT_1883167 [Mycena metata]|uniref:Uncharacterized protein n=1 Tax=Mycena metata TaxID=1033252 RepID=A0AAD7JMS7_9AGAR|nr:hypothetical protein B0H16DRAFT_1883167 [Mycena metata]
MQIWLLRSRYPFAAASLWRRLGVSLWSSSHTVIAGNISACGVTDRPDDLNNILDGSMPLLRNLNLSFDRATNPSPVDAVALSGTPLLCSSALNYAAAEFFVVPYAQLTTLRLIGTFHPNECVLLLQQAPNLVHCELAVVGDRSSVAVDVTLSQFESGTRCNNVLSHLH